MIGEGGRRGEGRGGLSGNVAKELSALNPPLVILLKDRQTE